MSAPTDHCTNVASSCLDSSKIFQNILLEIVPAVSLAEEDYIEVQLYSSSPALADRCSRDRAADAEVEEMRTFNFSILSKSVR